MHGQKNIKIQTSTECDSNPRFLCSSGRR